MMKPDYVMALLVDTTDTSSQCTFAQNLQQFSYKFPVPISSVVQPGPAITLPTILTFTIIHAPPLCLQESNKVSQSLHQFDWYVVQQQVLEGKFMDFNSLLPKVRSQPPVVH